MAGQRSWNKPLTGFGGGGIRGGSGWQLVEIASGNGDKATASEILRSIWTH